jgi:capsular exopolysaccharide synthesis family protein
MGAGFISPDGEGLLGVTRAMSKFFKALEQAENDRVGGEWLVRQERSPLAVSPAPASQPSDFSGERQAVAEPPHRAGPDTGPSTAAEPLDGVEQHLVSLLSPTSFEAEQYRSLRHMVEQLHKDAELHVLAVTSPAVGDGKTITAINLASALAQASDSRVLLVEADLRKPSIANLLGLARAGTLGLVELILDPTISLEDVVRVRRPFNLSLLPAGHPQLAPYETLKSPRLGELLEELRRRYDFIVLDTPPLVPFPDCLVLQRYIDGLIMVVAAHKTPRKLVGEALNVVDRNKIVGLVFNGDDRPRWGPYYHSLYGQSPNENGRGLWRRLAKIGGAFQRQQHPPVR